MAPDDLFGAAAAGRVAGRGPLAARLVAETTARAFEPLSAVTAGVKDVRAIMRR